MGIGRVPFVGIVTPDMHWLLSFGSMLIYKCATVAGDNTMQRRWLQEHQQGRKNYQSRTITNFPQIILRGNGG